MRLLRKDLDEIYLPKEIRFTVCAALVVELIDSGVGRSILTTKNTCPADYAI